MFVSVWYDRNVVNNKLNIKINVELAHHVLT